MVVSVRIEKGAEYSERKFATLCLIEGGLLRAINDIERVMQVVIFSNTNWQVRQSKDGQNSG